MRSIIRLSMIAIVIIVSILAILFIYINFIAKDMNSGKERFLAAVRQAVSDGSMKFNASKLGSRVCIIEDGVLAPDLKAKRFFTEVNWDMRDFVDQSSGYWNLVILDEDLKSVELVSIGQDEVSWRSHAEERGLPIHEEVRCVTEFIFDPSDSSTQAELNDNF